MTLGFGDSSDPTTNFLWGSCPFHTSREDLLSTIRAFERTVKGMQQQPTSGILMRFINAKTITAPRKPSGQIARAA